MLDAYLRSYGLQSQPSGSPAHCLEAATSQEAARPGVPGRPAPWAGGSCSCWDPVKSQALALQLAAIAELRWLSIRQDVLLQAGASSNHLWMLQLDASGYVHQYLISFGCQHTVTTNITNFLALWPC